MIGLLIRKINSEHFKIIYFNGTKQKSLSNYLYNNGSLLPWDVVKIMVNQFNAIKYHNSIKKYYFINKSDAYKAKDWLESRILLKKLEQI